VSFLIGLGLLALLVRSLEPETLRQSWQSLRRAQLTDYLLAIAVYYASFPVRSHRWRLLLMNAGVEPGRIPSRRSLSELIYLSWFANSLVPAKLGDVYRGWLLRRISGIRLSASMGTIAAERVIDFFVLVALLGVSGLVAFHGVLPPQIRAPVALGVFLVLVAAVGLATLWRLGAHLEGRLPNRLASIYSTFSEALLLSFDSLPLVLGLSLLAWSAEAGRVWFVTRALGLTSIEPAMIVALSLLAALLTVLPLTPGGLGFAEAGLTGALVLYGLDHYQALSVTLLDRTISYLSLVIGGALVYGLSAKTK
jgi:hypothetical protein